ncbi:hypothetical protein FW778_17175 [Ginsengibacter hankyongi]|uniref:Uncharacterized protein n=1 Tax=Ginsengibacter hankyongi TaxID=2607284 RepID=A0A5J5IDR6_9BACT|nr:hypothetical protein [Ginsengibacter hankyongi]KAA9037161.1 hypothetical protein FW778_17175 [Ginsengibacter hankyongi]
MLRILTGSAKPRCVAAFGFPGLSGPVKSLPASPRYCQFAAGERYGTSTIGIEKMQVGVEVRLEILN